MFSSPILIVQGEDAEEGSATGIAPTASWPREEKNVSAA
jgi:hypothetical protein